MVSWPGLLKWSLSHSDSTNESNFRPMDEETRKWLKEALEFYAVDEIEVLKRASEILSRQEMGNERELDIKLEALEEIHSLIENLEAARNLVKVGGLAHLVKCMIGSTYPEVRKKCAAIFTSAVQQNPEVQKAAQDVDALSGILGRIQCETDLLLKEQYVSALSSLVRGGVTSIIQEFLDKEGLQLILNLLSSRESLRIVKKITLLLSDLFYQDKEHNLNILPQATHLNLIQALYNLSDLHDDELNEMASHALYNASQIEHTEKPRVYTLSKV